MHIERIFPVTLFFRGTKFLVVAWLGMLVNTACLYLFKGVLHIPLIPASMMAIEVAIVHNFTWYRLWAWRDRGNGRHSFFRQLLMFNMAVGLVDLVLNVSILWVLATFAGVHYLLANLIGQILGPLFKFWLNDRLVFRERQA